MPRPEAFVKRTLVLTYASITVCSFEEGMAAGGWSKKLADLMSSAQLETEQRGRPEALKACPQSFRLNQSHVAQGGLELTEILLPLPPQCQD